MQYGHISAVAAQPRSAFDIKFDPADRTQVIVGSERGSSLYQLDDHIQVGANVAAVTVAETIAVSADAYIYYEFADNGTPTPTLKSSAAYPTAAAGKINAVLGKAIWSAALGEISAVVPYQYGHISAVVPNMAYLVKITGHATGTAYNCDIYGNGSGYASTGSGTLIIPQIVSGDVVPVGTWVNAILIGPTYYGQVPVWLDVGGIGTAPTGASGILTTTDATTTTLLSYTLATSEAAVIEAHVSSIGADRGGWILAGTFYESSGATQQGTTTEIHAVQSGSHTVVFDVTGTTVRVRVTGVASNVRWRGSMTVNETRF